MDPISTSLAALASSLTELVVKGTVSAVDKKIKANREQTDLEKVRTHYEELINEILQEREDAVRIAQAYKSELEKIVISDKDIEYLNNTIEKILLIIMTFSNKDAEESLKQVQIIKGLLNMDTLKTMQLLGFNYKAAIGEPLTGLCSNMITSWGEGKINIQSQQRKRR